MAKVFSINVKRNTKARLGSIIEGDRYIEDGNESLGTLYLGEAFQDARPMSGSSLGAVTTVKSLLKQYKLLEVALAKFNSKSSGIARANLLRMTLIPFLRSTCNSEESYAGDPKLYKSLINVSSSVLFRWWEVLLACISPARNQVSNLVSSDKYAYLECISRIMSRVSWQNMDSSDQKHYEHLLILTLSFGIHKLQTLKVLPLSMSAFVGKVIAYSFFYVPEVSIVLLFMLNVNQRLLELTSKLFDDYNIEASRVDELSQQFPFHLKNLINFQGKTQLNRKQKSLINCITAPNHPVPGIKEPRGLWVQRWVDVESDVFNSFFRHYVSIVNSFLSSQFDSDHIVLFHCPGFSILMSHINRLFHIAILNICRSDQLKVSSTSMIPIRQSQRRPYSLQNSPPSSSSLKDQETYIKSLMKIFRTIRDLNYTGSSMRLSSFADRILQSIARATSVHDHHRSGLIYSIVYELVNYVESDVCWEFWLSTIYMSLNSTDHLQVLQTSFAFLFNVWGMVPELTAKKYDNSISYNWIKDSKESIKVNFINWFISDKVWNRFFTHWHPLIRSYYMRIVIWRLIGVNNFEFPISITTAKRIQSLLITSYEKLEEVSRKDEKIKSSFRADNPLANKRVGVVSLNSSEFLLLVNSHNLNFGHELRKSHPYEVFDEAVYSCSSSHAHRSSVIAGSQKGHMIANSIGRLFKKFSTESESSPTSENEDQDDIDSQKTSSGASTPVSRSSSPSSMSYKSMSYTSSLQTESDALSYFTENSEFYESGLATPGAFYRTLSEIVRPAFKFEMMFDHQSMQEMIELLQPGRKYRRKFTIDYMPTPPTVPCISIHLESSSLNKFYRNSLLEESLRSCETNCTIYSQPDYESSPINWTRLGKALNEWNAMVDEFEGFLLGQNFSSSLSDLISVQYNDTKVSELDYIKRIIPFMTANSMNDGSIFNDIVSP